jgi:Tol biopolymer transport system component
MSTRILTVALTAMLAASVSGAGAAASTSAVPPAGSIVYSRIVTDARGGETSEIFVKVRGVERRLTRNSVDDRRPSWSTGRTRIAFVRNADIWVMRHDGSGARRLPGSARGVSDDYPAWSRDGRLIAFASARPYPKGEGGHELYVMRADGTGVRRLTRTKRWTEDIQPSFSPDGRHLAFARKEGFFELFRIRVADGGGLKQLTSWTDRGIDMEGDDNGPDWSPDGKRLSFVSDKAKHSALATIDANGGDRREVVTSTSHSVLSARWGPNGRRLLYVTAEGTTGPPMLRTVKEDGLMPVDVGHGFEGDW